tara:strand:+ start:229 stop:381 length:153 start_codon:yes stop_codon:yes gene_type:complete
MKVSLRNGKKDCTVYGLKFDSDGVCECKKEVAQSLIDTGILVEVTATLKK